MQHILTERGIDFEPYRAYLATIRDRLPDHVWAFASDVRHYQLDGPETLHDAWLESLCVEEPASGERSHIRRTAITLRLLGPMHDRVHVLRYEGVRGYRAEGRGVAHGHGDLFTHEVRLADDGQTIVHELLFVGAGGTNDGGIGSLGIECADFRYVAEPRSVQPRTPAG